MKYTIKDIARLAGVSTATVSKVINRKDHEITETTREKVMSIVRQYNYVPNRIASSMVTKKTHTIGLIIPDISNPFFPELARGVEDYASKLGYAVFLCNTDNDAQKERTYLEKLQEKMVDGIILTASSHRRTNSKDLKESNIPIVALDREIDSFKSGGTVISDNLSGAYEAVTYLLSRGLKNILYLAGPINSKPSKDRLQGYINALVDHNHQVNQEMILDGSFTLDWGYSGTLMAIDRGLEFDSIFCGNDLIAFGAIQAIKLKGFRVPQDISVIGFDDIAMAGIIDPPLTTVKQPNYQMGYESSKILIGIIEKHPPENRELVLNTKLIIRDSVI
ncbi:MAG: LacI family transcriptional regulator [Dethiosulfatibacter sp.]|nr:LacI family transcriptional regulator [Dethiosulfatibacter sp.]